MSSARSFPFNRAASPAVSQLTRQSPAKHVVAELLVRTFQLGAITAPNLRLQGLHTMGADQQIFPGRRITLPGLMSARQVCVYLG